APGVVACALEAAVRTLRALLALALLAGVYVVALLAALLSLALVAFAFSLARDKQAAELVQGVLMALGGLVALWAIGNGLFAIGQPGERPWGSVEVSRSATPQLWALVDEVAAEVGCAGPSRLYLTAEPNAAVAEQTRAAGLVTRSRRMYVGMP